MEEIDIWRSAALLIRQHGEDAAIVAAQRADALLSPGRLRGIVASSFDAQPGRRIVF